ncbi:MAG: hypothetical protein WCI18_16955 [Pseudomonadota bacterium]
MALAYAQSFPHRVSQIVLTSITTSQRSEADWLYKGAAKFFPAEFEAFESVVPASERGNLLSAYARLMEPTLSRGMVDIFELSSIIFMPFC